MKNSIADRARNIVVEHLGVAPEEVTDSAKFYDDFGADSLDQIELFMEFEEEFGLEISDEVAQKTETFGEAVAIVEKAILVKAAVND